MPQNKEKDHKQGNMRDENNSSFLTNKGSSGFYMRNVLFSHDTFSLFMNYECLFNIKEAKPNLTLSSYI